MPLPLLYVVVVALNNQLKVVVTSMPDIILCVIAIIHVMWIDMRIHNHTPTVTFVGLTTEKASSEIVNHDEAQTMPL